MPNPYEPTAIVISVDSYETLTPPENELECAVCQGPCRHEFYWRTAASVADEIKFEHITCDYECLEILLAIIHTAAAVHNQAVIEKARKLAQRN